LYVCSMDAMDGARSDDTILALLKQNKTKQNKTKQTPNAGGDVHHHQQQHRRPRPPRSLPSLPPPGPLVPARAAAGGGGDDGVRQGDLNEQVNEGSEHVYDWGVGERRACLPVSSPLLAPTNQPTHRHLPLALLPPQKLLGEARVAAWSDARRAAVDDMVVFMRTSETPGLLTDLDFSEDVCYNCSCSGACRVWVDGAGKEEWFWLLWCMLVWMGACLSSLAAAAAAAAAAEIPLPPPSQHTHPFLFPLTHTQTHTHTGDLICCDACTASFHLSCAGLWQLPEEAEWLCNRCKKGAARSKRDAAQRERTATGARA
jgi:hypothetical protein